MSDEKIVCLKRRNKRKRKDKEKERRLGKNAPDSVRILQCLSLVSKIKMWKDNDALFFVKLLDCRMNNMS